MPIACQVRRDDRLIIVSHSWAIPDSEFLASYARLLADEDIDKSYDVLIDLRQSDSSQRTSATLREFAELVRQHYTETTKRPKVAVVAPGDLSFGLARMYEAYSDIATMEFAVFRDIGAATSWLGAPAGLLSESGE